jgi:signal transduction histidine kinase
VWVKVLFAVRDQGQGIPAHELDKLFEPFQKMSVKGTVGEKSTGLGLSIVKKIVQGHGGEIWVESQVGIGTTFFVSLPRPSEGSVV